MNAAKKMEMDCDGFKLRGNAHKMVCPNGCNTNFTTTGHIMQEWEVDCKGNFVSVTDECLQMTHGADFDNIWTCIVCGSEGVPETIE